MQPSRTDGSRTARRRADVALVAVGGYGRAELAPGSDLDVLLVHRGRRDIDESRAVWYPIWEEGIALDHGVKTVDEALEVAGRDLKAALGLLDARTIAGDAELGDRARRRACARGKRKPKVDGELAEATACATTASATSRSSSNLS